MGRGKIPSLLKECAVTFTVSVKRVTSRMSSDAENFLKICIFNLVA